MFEFYILFYLCLNKRRLWLHAIFFFKKMIVKDYSHNVTYEEILKKYWSKSWFNYWNKNKQSNSKLNRNLLFKWNWNLQQQKKFRNAKKKIKNKHQFFILIKKLKIFYLNSFPHHWIFFPISIDHWSPTKTIFLHFFLVFEQKYFLATVHIFFFRGNALKLGWSMLTILLSQVDKKKESKKAKSPDHIIMIFT